jgi:predicted RNA polymerase sigma factor
MVLMDGGKMTSSVRVDVVVAAAPNAPANAPPVAPVLVAKVGTFSSLDAFSAVQPMQLKALKQADRHDDTEEAANEAHPTSHGEDPRLRKYQVILDSRGAR